MTIYDLSKSKDLSDLTQISGKLKSTLETRKSELWKLFNPITDDVDVIDEKEIQNSNLFKSINDLPLNDSVYLPDSNYNNKVFILFK